MRYDSDRMAIVLPYFRKTKASFLPKARREFRVCFGGGDSSRFSHPDPRLPLGTPREACRSKSQPGGRSELNSCFVPVEEEKKSVDGCTIA